MLRVLGLRRAVACGAVAAGLTLWATHRPPLLYAREADTSTLLQRVGRGDLAAVQRLQQQLAGKLDVNQRHPNGWTPLMVAAARGDLPLVEWLLAAGASVDAEDRYAPKSMTAVAAREREFPDGVVDRTSNTQGFTALFYAVLAGSAPVVRRLIEEGAEPGHKDGKGRAALDIVPYAPAPARAEIRSVLTEELASLQEARQRRERERRRQFPLEKRFREHIVGQEAAINAVSSAIRRKENGWLDSDHPLVFLFLGSSGVGKTELAKQVAAYLNGNDADAFIRIDMSEYSSQHEAAKFIGSPPGYVGHEEGGQLTKRLRKKPNAVVLLDEVEKAHPDVLTVMLQVFDEGRLTDGKGETIDCKQATFVMTSNLAQREIADHALELRAKGLPEDHLPEDFTKTVVQPILKTAFKRDEFLGRINETLYFLPFTEPQLQQLAERQLQRWARRAHDRHGVTLSWQPGVVDLVARGYNLRYGARSIQHEVDRKVIGKIAAYHEQELIRKGSQVAIGVDPQRPDDVTLTVTGGDPQHGILPSGAREALRRLF